MEDAAFNEFILAKMPYFIAVNYQRLLEAQQPQEQVALILHIYNLGLRALTINLVSQYVFRDRDRVSNPNLENLLKQKFPHLTPDAWEEMLFTTLKAYEGSRDLFFMPELYDFYWDTSTYPHEGLTEVKLPFDRLTQATLELQTKRLVPQDESSWQALKAELSEHLSKILQSLSFIGAYDLIHVLAQDQHLYTSELHKGIHISIEHRPLPERTRLTNGWFYLRSATEEFLSLHPLLVFWEDVIEPTDTGVFDRWVYERLRYLLATPGQTRLDEKRVRDFVRLLFSAITEAEREQQETEKLSWLQLCDICKDIARQRMATVHGKYHQELYLQRHSVRQHIEAFLADRKKRGFVLVGKSGVGKSNFLLALDKELQARSNVCMLMYDGANIPISPSALTDIIGKDFGDRGVLSRQPAQQVWQEIARIDGIDERLVVLCVDAVNENPQATALLRQLDELVQSAWPWLKIVLSSRPETWQSIKHGVKLAEALYYREPETGGLGVELEPFSYSEQMELFSRQELPEAYSKYHNRLAEAPQASALAPYIFTQYRRTGTVRTAWLETRVQAALSQHHLKFFEFLLATNLSQVGIEKQEPRAALATVELFFKSGDAEIDQMIQAFLSRLRIYYPDEVDEFLEEQQAPDEFRLQVRTLEPVERVGDLIAKRSWYFVRDSVLLGSPELRSHLQRLFAKGTDCKNTQAWMNYMIREVINLIYGDQIFNQRDL